MNKKSNESLRVFPLSNWTEVDIWQYILKENINIPSLYFAKERIVVERDGQLIMVDDNRLPLKFKNEPKLEMIRFRTLGCYPLTGAIRSNAITLEQIADETLSASTSERLGRIIDNDLIIKHGKEKRMDIFSFI